MFWSIIFSKRYKYDDISDMHISVLCSSNALLKSNKINYRHNGAIPYYALGALNLPPLSLILKNDVGVFHFLIYMLILGLVKVRFIPQD